MYLQLPPPRTYVNNWRRVGFDEEDFADGGSDRLVDHVVAWGDEATIAARVQAHFDAGADHVWSRRTPQTIGPTFRARNGERSHRPWWASRRECVDR